MTSGLCEWVVCEKGPSGTPAIAVISVRDMGDPNAPSLDLCLLHLVDFFEVRPVLEGKVLHPNPLGKLTNLEAALA